MTTTLVTLMLLSALLTGFFVGRYVEASHPVDEFIYFTREELLAMTKIAKIDAGEVAPSIGPRKGVDLTRLNKIDVNWDDELKKI